MVTPAAGGVLAEVLFGTTRQRLLAWLLSRPDQPFYLRELVRATGSGLGPVQRELAQLERAGIVSRHTRGKLVYFQANESCPILPELRSIVTKTTGVVEQLRAALAPLQPRITVAFVYGSFARGEERSASDVDVMVIGEVAFGEVVDALSPAQAVLQREINPSVYGAGEFERKVRDAHHFVTQVLRDPKVFVIGGPRELGRLGQTRMAARASSKTRGGAGARRKSGPRPQGKRHKSA
jgi:predicted nucleotidyltransferase